MITIVLDAGHGRKFPGRIDGACGNGLIEDDVVLTPDTATNLGLVNRLRHLFVLEGCKVVLTRTGPNALATIKKTDLARRVEIAKAADADLFISVHCNSVGNPVACGFEAVVEYGDIVSRQLSSEIYESIRKDFTSDDIPLRDIKWDTQSAKGGVYVLTHLSKAMPAVLLECLFLSNPKDAARLQNNIYRDRLCKAIVRGVVTSRRWKLKELAH
jgi:N-acetylmuramoyl-L-alanine amidase